jgi:Rrf2 family transcriptional regulator, nitric oxide-sensitive transcriptional repressor
MISQTAEYALRAIVYLAENETRPCTIQEIAPATQIPAGYLSKVMQELAKRGVVQSQRGLRGGFRLAVPAEDISVYDVVQAVDPIQRITRCPLNKPEHRTCLCPLHRELDAAAARTEEAFRRAPISEMVNAAAPNQDAAPPTAALAPAPI